MRKINLSLMAAAILASGMVSNVMANPLENILSNPKYSLELRPRYEYVDVDNNGKDAAKALTVRTAIGMSAQLFEVEGLNAQIQAMSVNNFGWIDDYAPETSGYETVADGTQSRITQANISYSANGFTAILGRKMVVLDNARFIGNVGWRQMPQTYDLAAVAYNGIENLSLLGAYVTQVNRIFNSDGNGPLNTHMSTGSVLLHASYKLVPELTLTAYDYMIENFADHIGIRATGKAKLDDITLKYTAEYAVQNDPSLDNEDDPLYSPNRKQDADYYNLALDATYDAFTAGIGYEVLSDKGDGDYAFWTPLATLHAMNGWADIFLNTPDQGLDDLSVKLAYNAKEYGKIVGIYHDFKSDVDNTQGDDDLGNEVDIAYKYKINKNLGFLLKGAWYNAGDDSFLDKNGKIKYHDTTKYWVQLDYKFSSK